MRFIFTFAILIVSIASSAGAQNCAAALISDVGILDLRTYSSLTQAELLYREKNQDKSWAVGIDVPIKGTPISGDGESAETLREEYFSQSNLEWTNERVVSSATQSLSRNSVEAYRACIDGQHRSGPRIIVHNATKTEATVSITWFSAPNAPTQVDNADITITGGAFVQQFPTDWSTGMRHAVVVSRNSGVDMRIVANVGGDSDNVFVALIPQEPLRVPLDLSSCVGKGGLNGVELWGPTSKGCAGLPPASGWGNYTLSQQLFSKMGSCVGYGGLAGVTIWGPPGVKCGGIADGSWGNYGDIQTKDVSIQGLGRCVGKGNILNGLTLWGPRGEPCGGISTWGDYN